MISSELGAGGREMRKQAGTPAQKPDLVTGSRMQIIMFGIRQPGVEAQLYPGHMGNLHLDH